MTTKTYLSQARYLDMRIKSKLQQIDSLNELATTCTSVLTGMPRNPSASVSRMADAAVRLLICKQTSTTTLTCWSTSRKKSWESLKRWRIRSTKRFWRNAISAFCLGKRSQWTWATTCVTFISSTRGRWRTAKSLPFPKWTQKDTERHLPLMIVL